MNTTTLSEQFGFDCHSIDATVSMIESPFNFLNGERLPIYTQELHNKIRIFDGGETILHFLKSGMDFTQSKKLAFITNAIEPYGVSLSASGEIEIYVDITNPKEAFSKFVYAMFAITSWELENDGKNIDGSILVSEVAMFFRAAYPSDAQVPSEEFVGISGHKYKFDFIHGDKAVLAITPHTSSVAAAIKKIIDLSLKDDNKIKPFVVIDDRTNKIGAENEMKIISAISPVMAFSKLEVKANINSSPI